MGQVSVPAIRALPVTKIAARQMRETQFMPDDIMEKIREKASERILFLPHAVSQMSRPERMITTTEVEEVVKSGELVEDYPEDARGHSCLLLGFGTEQRPIHVVCAPKDEYLTIITAYVPTANKWTPDFKRRL